MYEWNQISDLSQLQRPFHVIPLVAYPTAIQNVSPTTKCVLYKQWFFVTENDQAESYTRIYIKIKHGEFSLPLVNSTKYTLYIGAPFDL